MPSLTRDSGDQERDWIRGPLDEKAVAEGYWFDITAAERVVFFFESFLRHSKGRFAGQPFDLLDWQKRELLMPLFGWKRSDGTRRFRTAFVEIPKKNGKSALCSGISLYLLVGDGEAGAEVYSAAADRDQASIVFNESMAMVQQSKPLAKRLRVIASRKTIYFKATNSVYRCLSADVPTKEGLNIHGLIFDELHAQKSRALWDTLRYGGAARDQPLLISITTAGFDRQSVCFEQYEYARKVIRGDVEDLSFFPLIYEADPEKDKLDDPDVWRRANPSMGSTIKEDTFADEYKEAVEKPSSYSSFLRYRLNIWTQSETQWIDIARWDACLRKRGWKALLGAPCWCGLDLASVSDIAAFAAVFDVEGTAFVLAKMWVPKDNMHRRVRKDHVPYASWARAGLLTATPGDVIDYNRIEADIKGFAEQYEVREIGFDRWNAQQIVTNLQDHGLTMIPIGQGFQSMSGPMKEVEARILAKRIAHDGNKVLRWMVGNVQAERDAADNVKPSKAKSREKIDGVVALVMAMARKIAAEESESPYEDRGMLSL